MIIDYFSLPQDAQVNIISFLNLPELSMFQLLSSKCYAVSNTNFFWYEKVQYDFPFPQFRSKYDKEKKYKEFYELNSRKPDGKYYNMGLNSEDKFYQFEFQLESKPVEKYKVVTGKGSTFLIIGIQVGLEVIFFQYKLTMDYFAIVFSIKENRNNYSRWITNFNHGLAFSSKDENLNMKDILLNMGPATKNLSYDFNRNYKMILDKHELEFKVELKYSEKTGWKFKNELRDYTIEGIVNENFFVFVVDVSTWRIQKTMHMIIMFVDKEKKVEDWKGIKAVVEDSPKFSYFQLKSN